jgi:hypothetical protein
LVFKIRLCVEFELAKRNPWKNYGLEAGPGSWSFMVQSRLMTMVRVGLFPAFCDFFSILISLDVFNSLRPWGKSQLRTLVFYGFAGHEKAVSGPWLLDADINYVDLDKDWTKIFNMESVTNHSDS